MNTYDNYIVYLWLVPVIGLIIIPFLWSLFTKLYKTVERTRLATAFDGCVLKNGKNPEKRDSHRILLDEGHAYIDEENDCCRASVSNISKDGICLKHIPETMALESNPLTVLFRTPTDDYTFNAKLIWKKLTSKGYVIGAEIDRAPLGWDSLLKVFHKPCAGRDVTI